LVFDSSYCRLSELPPVGLIIGFKNWQVEINKILIDRIIECPMRLESDPRKYRKLPILWNFSLALIREQIMIQNYSGGKMNLSQCYDFFL
jgi:hypothetical protein